MAGDPSAKASRDNAHLLRNCQCLGETNSAAHFDKKIRCRFKGTCDK